MYENYKDSSPTKLADGVYNLVLVRCKVKYKTEYSKYIMTLVFKEIESKEEVLRTVSISSESIKSITALSTSNNLIRLIIGQEDCLELRRNPEELGRKVMAYGSGRIFKGFIQKNEKGYLDIINLGEEGGKA